MPKIRNKTNELIIKRVSLTLFFCLFVSLAFAAAPNGSTITPTSGLSQPNQQVIFTATYTDPDGWKYLPDVRFLIGDAINYNYCFYARYNKNTNKLYLCKDNDTNEATCWLGGFTPGSINIIENSYAKLDCSKTTVSISGNTLTLKWAVTFKSTFTGAKNTYLTDVDDLGVYWAQTGTWLVVVNSPPNASTITPTSGTSQPNQQVVFTATYTDPDGWQNLFDARFLINTAINGSYCFYARYDQNTNKLYLCKDNDLNEATRWLGGFTPGSTNIIENSYAKLDCSKTAVSGSGTTLTIKWAATFKSTFTGVKNTYLMAKDDLGSYYYWTQKGDFCIFKPPISPP